MNKTGKMYMGGGILRTSSSWLLLMAAISFQFCVFAPLEAYFSNAAEFWFRLPHLLPIVLTVFAVVFVVLSAAGLLLGRTKAGACLYSFFLLLAVYFYIQGNFIPRDYGVFNGTEINWDEHTLYGVLSIALAVLCMGLWIACNFVLRLKKSLLLKIGRTVSLFLLGIQALTLGTLFVQNNVIQRNGSPDLVVTTDKMFEFSDKNNILFVLLDAFDAGVMNSILTGDEADFVKDTLRDFTYYPDTVGMYTVTMYALPHILTGVAYKNEQPYKDYVRKAYADNPLYNEFTKRNYSIGVYTTNSFVNPDCEMYENISYKKSEIKNKSSFAGMFFRLVAFNYMPHQLKKNFVVSNDEFLTFRISGAASLFSWEVQDFYKTVKTSEIMKSNSDNVFRFIHLAGIHAPSTFGKELLTERGVSYKQEDEALGCMTLLSAFFDKLRDSGIYGSSTIVVLADHGYKNYGQNPLFLVKNKDESHAFTASDAKMSYAYIRDLLLSLLQDSSEISEDAIKRLEDKNETRRFLRNERDDTEPLPYFSEIVCDGNAAEPEDFTETGIRYFSKNVNRQGKYKLGQELQFSTKGAQTGNVYCVKGFSLAELEHTWTNGKEAIMRFKLGKIRHNLCLNMRYHTYGRQTVRLYANDCLVADYIANGETESNFIIPKECFADKKNELTLRLELPDAVSPLSENKGNWDARILALAFESMVISSTKEEFNLKKQTIEAYYELGTPLSFAGKDGNTAQPHKGKGFSEAEEGHAWTDGNRAELRFDIGGAEGDLLCRMEHFTFNGEQRVTVSANGTEIASYTANGDEAKEILIPAGCVGDDGMLVLSFDLPDAKSPLELGLSADDRKLALAMRSLVIKAAPSNEEVRK